MNMFGLLNVKQTLLIFALIWGSQAHPGKRCFTEEELEEGADKILRRNMYRTQNVAGVPYLRVRTNFSCPTELYPKTKEYSDRSISPWRHRDDYDENRFPKLMQVAECLCSGCIVNGAEDNGYNSVPVIQNMIVFKRHACPNHPGKYFLTSQYIDVPVGCTCVVPK